MRINYKDIFIALVVIFLLTPIGFGITDGTSMYPKIKNNHLFVYSKLQPTSKLNAGDIVVIHNNDDNMNLVKRIVGISGSQVYMFKGNVLGYDDVLFGDTFLSNEDYANVEVITVKPNEIFYIGDNQENSIDSRHKGTIPEDWVIGKVVFVL